MISFFWCCKLYVMLLWHLAGELCFEGIFKSFEGIARILRRWWQLATTDISDFTQFMTIRLSNIQSSQFSRLLLWWKFKRGPPLEHRNGRVLWHSRWISMARKSFRFFESQTNRQPRKSSRWKPSRKHSSNNNLVNWIPVFRICCYDKRPATAIEHFYHVPKSPVVVRS